MMLDLGPFSNENFDRKKWVAEFANVRKQLEVLEDRLESMVQPRLTDAISNRKVDVARDLRGILIWIGRFKSMELHYTKVHLKPIKQLWQDFDSKQPPSNMLATDKTSNEFQSAASGILFSTWLPNFYDELLLYLEQEYKWYYPLIHTFNVVSVFFSSRIETMSS